MECSLGLFAKFPQPGQVKSRLAVDTSPAWAAQVAAAFLRDALVRLAVVEAARYLVFSPPERESHFDDLCNPFFGLRPQSQGDLGQRLEQFIRGRLEAGSRRVVVVGSDSPPRPPTFVQRAFQELDQANVVLGPAQDGGYYLVGCRDRLPPIFDKITWSGSGVLSETIACLGDPDWRLALLPPWYDVDTLTDWRMRQGHVSAMRRAGIDPNLPHTEPLLRVPNPVAHSY